MKTGHGPNYWTDDPNPAAKIGPYKGAAHVREHQGEIYRDMYAHFDRAKNDAGAQAYDWVRELEDGQQPVLTSYDWA